VIVGTETTIKQIVHVIENPKLGVGLQTDLLKTMVKFMHELIYHLGIKRRRRFNE
jgi:hypothetical protein